jgi:hypothetical protein
VSGSFLRNEPWEVTLGASGTTMLYVAPGHHEYVLGTKFDPNAKYDTADFDYVFRYARFGINPVQPGDITYIVPEPSPLVLLFTGAFAVTVGWWRRKRSP